MTPTDAPATEAVPTRAGLRGGVLSLVFLLLVGVAAFAASLFQDDGIDSVETGEPAPQISVTTFDGGRFDLEEHISSGGGPVLLNLWASWCEPCLEEFPVLADFARSRSDVTVVGVAVQDQEPDARAFVERFDPPFTVAYDEGNRIRDAYPTYGLPVTILIDSDGIVSRIVIARLTPERLAELPIGA